MYSLIHSMVEGRRSKSTVNNADFLMARELVNGGIPCYWLSFLDLQNSKLYN